MDSKLSLAKRLLLCLAGRTSGDQDTRRRSQGTEAYQTRRQKKERKQKAKPSDKICQDPEPTLECPGAVGCKDGSPVEVQASSFSLQAFEPSKKLYTWA